MFTLARNELYRLFLSPLAWVILALSQLILAYLFLTHIDYFIQIQPKISAIPGAPGVTELIAMPLLSNTATILLLLAPLITMRLIAEDRRNDSLPLLLSAPLSIHQIVLGKYLGTVSFFIILLLLISLMPLSLALGSDLDFGLLAAGLLGLCLLVASFTAIGLYLSSLTKQPAIAAISTFSCLFLLWIIDWAGSTQMASESSGLFSWLSSLRHFEPLLQGEVNTSDIAYYLIIITAFLALTIRRLDSERLN
ncbi:MAG: ABC transporter permease [Gammaproteobacteria bacterium]|nr:MAG: ABC transporter permease [Gammaproteobacteria bacterium]RKZ94886.1 MAG: ABC transporter permease [Gammaproteobacteria bacterium]RKZ98850.1 MAG: ABC transporter permease [Gammaproteobacteria bacterium]RLA01742.1 MAG: ABC transporter permease [Gammaproteobacteria bacterium]HHA19915.1 ABC transporter permease [Methylophaga sp.]